MTACVILYRIGAGPVLFVADATDEVSVFPDRDAAVAYALNNRLFESGQATFQIVELDEL